MRKLVLCIFFLINPVFLLSQETINEAVEADSKSTTREEAQPEPKEKDNIRKNEAKSEPKQDSKNESDTKSERKNSVEFRLGVLYAGEKYHPAIGILYERALTSNWSIGGSLQRASLTTEIKGGSLESRQKINAALIPLDFLVAYHFRAGASFRPFVRGYIGPTVLHIESNKRSFNENYFHLGLGVGFRYHFSETIYATTEVSGNLFMGSESSKARNNTLAQIGIGFAF